MQKERYCSTGLSKTQSASGLLHGESWTGSFPLSTIVGFRTWPEECYFSVFSCSQKKLRCDGTLLEVIPRFYLCWETKLQRSFSLSHACGMEVTRTYVCTCPLPLSSPAEFEICTCSRITHMLNCVHKFLQLWELNGKINYEIIRQSHASPSATPPTSVTCNRALSWFWFPLRQHLQLF